MKELKDQQKESSEIESRINRAHPQDNGGKFVGTFGEAGLRIAFDPKIALVTRIFLGGCTIR